MKRCNFGNRIVMTATTAPNPAWEGGIRSGVMVMPGSGLSQANSGSPRYPSGQRVLFDLAPGWALGCDDLQWILLKARNRKLGDLRSAWDGVAFVATHRSILERRIREAGIVIEPEARRSLDALPERFPSK